MAAMMSRALAFSPLATATAGEGCSDGEAIRSGASSASAGAGVAVAGGGASCAAGGSGSAADGLEGRASNSVGWRRTRFSRATYDGG